MFGASEDEAIRKVRTLSEDVKVLDENNSCDGLRYELNGEEATLTECTNKAITEVEVPKFVSQYGKTYKVTSIGEYAFNRCSLSSIKLPDSLTSIGNGAFVNCRSLSSIKLPDSLTSIGGSAFSGCSNLSSIKLPDSLTSIGEGAFWGCSRLSSIIIPKGAKCKSILEDMGLGSKIDEVDNSESNADISTETTPFVPSDSQQTPGNNGNSLDTATQSSQSTALDSELMLDEEGSSKSLIANLYEKITAGSVGNSQISEWLKNSTQKVISKLENILQVKENTSNSLVIDVSSVSEDISKNEMTLHLDKSYINKEMYITCIYDDNNIFYLTGEGKWEKLTEETKEVKGVKMDASSSFKFKNMMKECVFIITTKD